MKKITIAIFICLLCLSTFGQTTVGLLQSNSAEDGYVLFAPIKSDTTYLIDKCCRLIHQWASPNTPGMSVYLLPDGSLLRSANVPNQYFRGNGAQGGAIEKYDWNNNLTWSYTLSSDTQTQNHDIYPLANGNILVVIWEAIDSSRAIAAGKNPALLLSTLYSAKIQELQPVGTRQANVVWQWKLWDHLIQDFDASKNNYGVVANHPELVNLNYTDTNIAAKDWIHANAVTYNSDLDQIILSVHNLSEIWILDHSTTTAQATTHTGGVHGKGGDLMYRWGNPQVYGRGTSADQVFFTQHNPVWIPSGYPHAGSISIFNNGVKRPGGNASSVDIFTPPIDSNGNYTILPGQSYGPSGKAWTYEAPTPSSFFSTVMGSAQLLANGNILVCQASQGLFFEIDSNKNMLWKYQSPVNADTAVAQGTRVTNGGVFRCTQYDASYSGFAGQTLNPLYHIERNPIFTACDSATIHTDIAAINIEADIKIYPNPADDRIFVILAQNSMATYSVSNMLGQIVAEGQTESQQLEISMTAKENGIYTVKIETDNKIIQKKIIINH
jgi:hypothetical protein